MMAQQVDQPNQYENVSREQVLKLLEDGKQLTGVREVTKHVMITQGAQSDAESVFSIGRRVVTDLRSRLKPDNVDSIVFLHDLYKYRLGKGEKL